MTACLVVLYRTLVEMDKVPDFFEGVTFTDVPFQLTSFAMSLLLVFRTDAGYSRWCAALGAWGTLRNSSAEIVRKASAWVSDTAHLRRLVRWVAAFPLALMVELRHDQEDPEMEVAMGTELQGVLLPHELKQVLAAGPYYHQFCLSVLTALVEAAQLGESREAAMLGDLHGFNHTAGECEKILRFPIPLTYTRHTSRFMLIYLGALPLALYDSCDWAVIPVTVVVSFLLLGIEDIGVQIEEPFSILPLPDICADLRKTAQRAVAQRGMVRCLADPNTCHADFEEPESEGEEAGLELLLGAASGDEWVLEAGFDAGTSGSGGVSVSGSNAKSAGRGRAALSSRSPVPYADSSKGPGLVAATTEHGNDNGNGNGNGNGGGGTGSGWRHRH